MAGEFDPARRTRHEIVAIVIQPEIECLAEVAGTASQCAIRDGSAPHAHQIHSLDWFDGPDEHSAWIARGVRDDIEHRMDAVRPVHVDNARHASEFFDAVPVKRGVRRRIVETETADNLRLGRGERAPYTAMLLAAASLHTEEAA